MTLAKRRQVVLMKPGKPGEMPPLGSQREFRACMANYNTAGDGSPPKGLGTEFLYGPGLVIEIATAQDDVKQAIVTLQDEDVAFPVLSRVCKEQGWSLMDMETGRVFK
jgi:hypothetical protein